MKYKIFILIIFISLKCVAKTDTLFIDNHNIDNIQYLIDSINTDTLLINLEKNNYELQKPLLITSKTTSLILNGNNSIFMGTMPEQYSLNRVTGIIDFMIEQNITIYDLTINFYSTDYGIISTLNIISNYKTVNLKNITTNGASFCGIYVQKANNGIIENCNCYYNQMGGLCINSSNNLTVQNCEFSYNGCQTPVWGYGFAIVNGLPSSKNIIVRNNKAINNQRKGFDVHSGINILFESNYVKGFEYAGIYAVSDEGKDRRVANVTIRDNFIDGDTAHFKIRGIDVGSYGKNPDSCGYFIIENNKVINIHNIENSSAISVCNPDSGVAIENVIIRGNTIENGSADKKTSAIECLQNDVFIKSIIIEKNRVHSEFSKFPIFISGAENADIKNNDIFYNDKIRSKKGIKIKNVKQVTLSDNIVKLK